MYIKIIFSAYDASRHRHEGHHGPQRDDALRQPVPDPRPRPLQPRPARGRGLEQGAEEEVVARPGRAGQDGEAGGA